MRLLLMQPLRSYSQREIARLAGLSEGFVSRIVARLATEGFIARDPIGQVKPVNPALLLDAWRESYQFSKHSVLKGHVSARSGDALLEFASDILCKSRIGYAATGLAAAWALTKFAGFRLTTLYLREEPSAEVLERLGFREEPRGANLWLVVPNDEGVFFEASPGKGATVCVHPVQIYLDLKEQPERAKEAAERVRADLLLKPWGNDG